MSVQRGSEDGEIIGMGAAVDMECASICFDGAALFLFLSSVGLCGRGQGVDAAAQAAFEVLWSGERQRQMAFHQFGMELIVGLNLQVS